MTEPPLPELEAERDRLYAQLSMVGDFRRGPVGENYRKCGKPDCGCAAAGHPGHGPRLLRTRSAGSRRTAGRQTWPGSGCASGAPGAPRRPAAPRSPPRSASGRGPQRGAGAAVPAPGHALRRDWRHRRDRDRGTGRRARRQRRGRAARTREVKLAVFFTQDHIGGDGYRCGTGNRPVTSPPSGPASVPGDLVKAQGIRRGADHVRQLTIPGGRRHHHAPPPSGQPPRRPHLACMSQPGSYRLTSHRS